MKSFATLVTVLLLATEARAQELNLATLDDEPNRVHVTTGAEYAFVAGAGYSRIQPFLDRRIVLTGEVVLPWAGLDVSDYRMRASALVPVVGTQRWRLAASLGASLRGNENPIGTLVDAGLDVALVGGFYTRRFYVAGEAGFDAALTTHVSHSDEYRMGVHADAVDGWYGNPGGNLRAGVQGGVTFSRYDVILRAGRVVDVGGDPPLFPIYGTLTVNARF